ncbi:MAG: homoserine O-succinyltransferase [Oscillospiraceae bacterium]|jgi:homoserine O-succinyltransferase|nr:homoserine O-succinyltransferase [Oscillospiraceae bacterium]
MPLRISENLPAFRTLMSENIFVMSVHDADTQDIRPLKIVILNLMPKKIETEEQLMRLLSNTPLQVDVELLHVRSHISKNTPLTHLDAFYTSFENIKHSRYDGLIITGAPVETLDFQQVDYWPELCEIMEWSKTNVYSAMHICWGAQAGLYYHFGIEKRLLKKKLSGIFPHAAVKKNSQLLKGFDDIHFVPHSRYTESIPEEIQNHPQLEILSSSHEAGINAVQSTNGRQFFIFGHVEYEAQTLANEYFRDLDKGLNITRPVNYFPEDNINEQPPFIWSGHANLMFSNWLNYCVYQKTPYNFIS